MSNSVYIKTNKNDCIILKIDPKKIIVWKKRNFKVRLIPANTWINKFQLPKDFDYNNNLKVPSNVDALIWLLCYRRNIKAIESGDNVYPFNSLSFVHYSLINFNLFEENGFNLNCTWSAYFEYVFSRSNGRCFKVFRSFSYWYLRCSVWRAIWICVWHLVYQRKQI